jgi:hypothetical protein
MKCFFCGDPAAHPATGCQYSEHVLACAACTRAFWAWVRRHTAVRPRPRHSRHGGPKEDFYGAAARLNPFLDPSLRGAS